MWLLEEISHAKDVWGVKVLCLQRTGSTFLSETAKGYRGTAIGDARVAAIQNSLSVATAEQPVVPAPLPQVQFNTP